MLLKSSFAEETIHVQRSTVNCLRLECWSQTVYSIITIKLIEHSIGSITVCYMPDIVLYELYVLSHEISTRPHEVGTLMMIIYLYIVHCPYFTSEV